MKYPDFKEWIDSKPTGAKLTGGDILACGGRCLRHGERISSGDYVVAGGMVGEARPVEERFVGQLIFNGRPGPSVLRLPNTLADTGPLQ